MDNNNKINKYLFIYNNNNNKKPTRDILFTNKINGETYLKLKEILLRERKPLGVYHQESAEEYIIKHGDGNPTSTLDQFADKNFIIMPQFYRPISIWEKYLTKCSKEEYKKYCARLEELLHLEQRVTSAR